MSATDAATNIRLLKPHNSYPSYDVSMLETEAINGVALQLRTLSPPLSAWYFFVSRRHTIPANPHLHYNSSFQCLGVRRINVPAANGFKMNLPYSLRALIFCHHNKTAPFLLSIRALSSHLRYQAILITFQWYRPALIFILATRPFSLLLSDAYPRWYLISLLHHSHYFWVMPTRVDFFPHNYTNFIIFLLWLRALKGNLHWIYDLTKSILRSAEISRITWSTTAHLTRSGYHSTMFSQPRGKNCQEYGDTIRQRRSGESLTALLSGQARTPFHPTTSINHITNVTWRSGYLTIVAKRINSAGMP